MSTSALLGRLVDDAALFPPARLPMPDAVAGHLAAKAGPTAWLVGRFLCPASRLAELRATEGAAAIEVGAILDTVSADSPEDAVRAAATDALSHGAASLEVAAGGPGLDDRVALLLAGLDVVPATTAVYVELPRAQVSAWPAALRVLASARAAGRQVGAKIRCGGADANAFPSQGELAAFVAGCQAARVPFKATAGLHHAVRHTDPDTGFEHHGFLNLLLASAAALRDDPRAVAELLATDDPGRLVAAAAALDDDTARRTRADLLVSYGSCSLAEPAADLWSLGLAPEPAVG